jgi:hypothetical protein
MHTDNGQERYQHALSVGRSWAVRQLELAGEIDVAADLEDTIPEASSAYIAIKAGRLPSLLFTALALRQLEFDISAGFQIGASDVLAGIGQSRVDGAPLSEARASLRGGTRWRA